MEDKERKFYANVFTWLFIGLFLTFGIGFVATKYEPLMLFALKSYFIFIIAQIVICIILSARVAKLEPNTAKALYLGYTMLTGLTFSSIFIAYDVSLLIFVFLATAVVFGIFAFIGKTTKINLNNFGMYLLIALVAMIVLELINIFILNEALDLILCCAGIAIFVGYTAYDMQKIKYFAQNDRGESFAILGALELYLDFINLFIRLLNLLKRDD